MILQSKNNIHFKLEVLRFEFDTSNTEEDLNWLEIKIEVQDGLNSWTAQGPYITDVEFERILEWFENLGKEESITFWENELAFKLGENGKVINVILDFNFHPSGDSYDYENDREYVLSFPIESLNTEYIISTIKRDISKIKYLASER